MKPRERRLMICRGMRLFERETPVEHNPAFPELLSGERQVGSRAEVEPITYRESAALSIRATIE
jgi:hypothetical protein